jgi:hypothetical protein
MRVECEAALVELGQQQQQTDGACPVDAAQSAVDSAAVVGGGGGATCIGDLMKAFVALMQVIACCWCVQCAAMCDAVQDDKCTTASTLVRAVEKLAPSPVQQGSAAPAAAAAAADEPAAAILHPLCSLCRLPVVSSLDFRHSDEAGGRLGELQSTVCYSCKVMRVDVVCGVN